MPSISAVIHLNVQVLLLALDTLHSFLNFLSSLNDFELSFKIIKSYWKLVQFYS